MIILRRTINIVECTDERWMASDLHYGTVRFYKHAKYALNAVKRHDRKRTLDGVSCITTVKWQTTTEIGWLIVQALQV